MQNQMSEETIVFHFPDEPSAANFLVKVINAYGPDNVDIQIGVEVRVWYPDQFPIDVLEFLYTEAHKFGSYKYTTIFTQTRYFQDKNLIVDTHGEHVEF